MYRINLAAFFLFYWVSQLSFAKSLESLLEPIVIQNSNFQCLKKNGYIEIDMSERYNEKIGAELFEKSALLNIDLDSGVYMLTVGTYANEAKYLNEEPPKTLKKFKSLFSEHYSTDASLTDEIKNFLLADFYHYTKAINSYFKDKSILPYRVFIKRYKNYTQKFGDENTWHFDIDPSLTNADYFAAMTVTLVGPGTPYSQLNTSKRAFSNKIEGKPPRKYQISKPKNSLIFISNWFDQKSGLFKGVYHALAEAVSEFKDRLVIGMFWVVKSDAPKQSLN